MISYSSLGRNQNIQFPWNNLDIIMVLLSTKQQFLFKVLLHWMSLVSVIEALSTVIG